MTNTTGHRFPSGVAFRRAFIEFRVLDSEGETIWVSGHTNRAGVIQHNTRWREGEVAWETLNTEFLKQETAGVMPRYQPHYQVITKRDQVQIYEELTTNVYNEFTNSFIHRVNHVKDNRLLTQGYVPAWEFAFVPESCAESYEKGDEDCVPEQGEVILEFMQATEPERPSVIGTKNSERRTGKNL